MMAQITAAGRDKSYKKLLVSMAGWAEDGLSEMLIFTTPGDVGVRIPQELADDFVRRLKDDGFEIETTDDGFRVKWYATD